MVAARAMHMHRSFGLPVRTMPVGVAMLMLVRVLVVVLACVSMSMAMSARARGIGATFGLKRRQHFIYNQTLAAQHLGQHRVGLQLQSVCL